MDKVRRYWDIQIAICYGIATFYGALAIFHSHLSKEPWERVLSPILISPTLATLIITYFMLKKRKKHDVSDEFLFRKYLTGIVLAVTSLIIGIVVEKL
jgi:purine-cytosine permease-like protein